MNSVIAGDSTLGEVLHIEGVCRRVHLKASSRREACNHQLSEEVAYLEGRKGSVGATGEVLRNLDSPVVVGDSLRVGVDSQQVGEDSLWVGEDNPLAVVDIHLWAEVGSQWTREDNQLGVVDRTQVELAKAAWAFLRAKELEVNAIAMKFALVAITALL